MENKIFTITGLFLLIKLFFSVGLSAQELNVSGKVTDADGFELIGVTIFVNGTTIGTSTDMDGNYSIRVPDLSSIIVISYVGYDDQEFAVDGRANIDVILLANALDIEEIVITGFSNPKSRLESSVAITALGGDMIEQLAPISTADLLQAIPGFLVESSGGEVGNNLFARGIPSAGAYEFVQIQEDGLPVFEDGALQFGNADNWYRLDETVKRMEAVRGGSASIVATNSPGGIINFISKTGQNSFDGKAKMTVSDFGLIRSDLNLGGALVQDKLYYNIGGFYRVDDGIRDPGFEANKGGQVKANMTYNFDKGYVRVTYKKLNDRNLFLLPIPLKNTGDGVEGLDNFDPNYGTLTSRNFSRLRVPQLGGGFFEKDLEDGVNPNVDAIGAQFAYHVSDKVQVRNSFRNTTIDLNYNAIFSTGGPDNQANFATDITQFPIEDATNASYTYVDDGSALAPGTLVMRADHWFINKEMSNFANNLSFLFNLDQVQLSVGHYYSNWKSNQYWNWSNYIIDVDDNPRLVNLVDNSTGISRTFNGVERITWLERDAQTKGKLNALFADAEFSANDKININVGVRYDIDRYSGYRDNAQFFSTDLGVLDDNTADDVVTVVAGSPYTYWTYDVDELSYTAALNYKLSSSTAFYTRWSHGFRSPIEEAYYDNASNLENIKITKVNQAELGYKYKSSNLAIFANAFYMKMDNIAFADILANGMSENKFADVQNYGLEIETIFNLDALTLNFNGTIQNPTYKDFVFKNASGEIFNYDGNTARRIPKYFFTIRPDYNITEKLNVYTKWSYFAKKYTGADNLVELEAFNVLNAGASYKINSLRFGVDASNVLNTIGLTEGNPRQTTSASDDVFLARPILGRAIKFSVAVDF